MNPERQGAGRVAAGGSVHRIRGKPRIMPDSNRLTGLSSWMTELNWERFRQQVNSDAVFARRSAGSNFRVLLGWGEEQYLVTVRDGRVDPVESGPFVMPQCDFALNGSASAWDRFAAARPAPREQDIYAFFRSGEIVLGGDTRKFYAHLMCLKLLLLHLRKMP